jgi:hypothetical protein
MRGGVMKRTPLLIATSRGSSLSVDMTKLTVRMTICYKGTLKNGYDREEQG